MSVPVTAATAIKTARSWFYDITLLLVAIGLLFSIFLGNRPLAVPDEARYSEIPREMLVSKDFVTPHLNGVKYFEKPPLFYWVQAASLQTFGINEWAARLPNLLIALLGCILVYAASRLLYERSTAITAALILATSLFYYAMAHVVTLDMTVSVWLTGSLLCFLVASQRSFVSGFPSSSVGKSQDTAVKNYNPIARSYKYWFLASYIFAALAVLTKGLIGIIFPGIIIGIWILLLNRWWLLKRCYLISGILLFLIIALPWHILVQARNPEFFNFYFIEQHFLRYFTLAAGRYKPVWFFLPILFLGLMPWVAFLLQAIFYHLPKRWSERQHYATELFLLSWAILIFVFYSFSDSKLIPYILPVIPPLVILIAHYLMIQIKKPVLSFGMLWGVRLVPSVILFVSAGLIIATHYYPLDYPHRASHYIWVIGVVWVFSGLLAYGVFTYRYRVAAGFILLLGTAVTLVIMLKSVPLIDTTSIKPLAMQLKPILQPNDEVAAYHHYYQDLPFYLQRRVTVVAWQNELSFGMAHQDTRAWMIDDITFWQRWHSNQRRVYVVMSTDQYRSLLQSSKVALYPLAKTPDDILLTNHP